MYQLVPAGDTGTIKLQPGLTDLGRDNLGKLGDALATIHRSHAQVLLEGSSVRLTSLGSNPTGVRCRGAEWRWLAKDEAVELADGMELAFSKSKKLRTQSTFVLCHTPTVTPGATSTSEPSGQPELIVKADSAPGEPAPGSKPEASVKPEADVKAEPAPGSKPEPGVKAEPSVKSEPGVKPEPSVKSEPSAQSRDKPAAQMPPAPAAAAASSLSAALASDSARHVFKAGASGKREHGEEAGRGGGGGGGGGKPSEEGGSRTLGEILREEEAAAASKRKRKAAADKPAPPERRYDGDRRLYTRAAFVEYYGGELEWDAAPRKLPRKPAAAAAGQTQARADGEDEADGEPAAAAAAAVAAAAVAAAAGATVVLAEAVAEAAEAAEAATDVGLRPQVQS